MKKHCTLVIALALCAASCAAQPTAKAPEPAKPAEIAAEPVPPAQVGMKEQAKQLKVASDHLKNVETQLFYLDRNGETDDGNRTLVLSREGHEPKNHAETEEDLNVMSRILEKASTSHDERAARAMGIFYRSPFGSGAPAVRNMYLEGYGAIFFLNVTYRLTPPPPKAEQKPTEKENRDAEWDNARRELEQPRGSHIAINAEPFAKEPDAADNYDAERVETLKKELSQALRNAAHIRDLKSGETVTVIVSGRGGSGRRVQVRARRLSPDENAEAPAPAPTTQQRLIIRAKKSDIDAFQNEKLSPDEFRTRVSVSLS